MGLRPWHYLNELVNFSLGIHPRAHARGPLLIWIDSSFFDKSLNFIFRIFCLRKTYLKN